MLCMEKNQQKKHELDLKAKKIENYVFKYDDLLGKGNFGEAYKGLDVLSGKQVAVKVIKMESIKSHITKKLLENQITILKTLKEHPNILKCCNVFTSLNNCYLITQLCQRDLQKELKKRGRFTEDDVKLIIYGVYKGLQELAKNSIIHRDIKVANIFLSKNGIPKIADFGFAVNSNAIFKDANIGSPIYMSPQGLLYREYSPKTDIWSFGVLIYELLFGVTPLQKCITQKQLKTKILQPPPYPFDISPQLKQLINTCMTVDPFKRPNIFQVGELPYFKEVLIQTPKKPILLKSSSKILTECSINEFKCQRKVILFKNALSYENGVSLLHYCRLLNKLNNKFVRSKILQQFLLNLSSSLLEVNFSTSNTNVEQIKKLKKALAEYDLKYRAIYEDMEIFVSPRQILSEISRLMQETKSKICLQALHDLDEETKVLVYSLEHENADIFTKHSQAKTIIEQGKFGIH